MHKIVSNLLNRLMRSASQKAIDFRKRKMARYNAERKRVLKERLEALGPPITLEAFMAIENAK